MDEALALGALSHQSPFPFEMWRIELLHPTVVHFPIALLIVSTLLFLLLALFFRSERAVSSGARERLTFTARFLLVAGVLGAWAAVISGDTAESIVNRVICNPEVTHEHAYWAEWAAYLYSAALLAVFGDVWLARRKLVGGVLSALALLLMIAGVGALSYASHLGGSLVYQQGAAVYRASPQCTEFQ
jgi:uncharacterized membrane protein